MKCELTNRHAIGSPGKMHLAQKVEEILQTHYFFQNRNQRGKLTDSVFEWSSSAAFTEVTFGKVTTVAVSFFPPSFDILASNLSE